MHGVASHPETTRSSADTAMPSGPTTRSLSRSGLALMVAIVAPLAILGLLVLVGFGIGAAVCITFVLVFAVTTTMDLRWFLQRRRLRNDPCRSRS